MEISIIDEAKRCLQCANPKCSKGCPVNTSIKEMIKMMLDGEIISAGEMLFQNNPLSLICSLVCPHDKQCEGSCVLGKKGQPIHVSGIEHYISDYYINLMTPSFQKDPNKKVAIIGSGPAGITIAVILASRGYDITIFEAHDKIGGILMYGIPEFRLPKAVLQKLMVKIREMGIKIRPNTMIGSVITIDDLFRDGYKAVFIGTGVWKPKTLGIKGESLGNVHFAIDYLKNPDVYALGESVCIIGAGNAAIDVARSAIRKGVRRVTIMYRGNPDTIPGNKHEVEMAKVDGVKFEYNKVPVEFTDDGVLYVENVTSDAEPKSQESSKLFKVDSMIVAISQGPRNYIVSTTNGIAIDDGGLVSADSCGRTTRAGVFASGDVVTGANTVVEAVRISKDVADAMDDYVLRVINKTN